MYARQLIFAFTALSTLGALEEAASAQILNTARCKNAYGVSDALAQIRMHWGLYCRDKPTAGAGGAVRPGTAYLTDASHTDYYATANVSLRPKLFPTYWDSTNFTIWDVPGDVGEDCTKLPFDAFNVGLCVAGCYTPETPLRFAEGEIGIREAAESGKVNLVTLSPESTIDRLRMKTNKVERYTVDIREGWEDIYNLKMESGGSLRVTSEHPLVTSDGRMRQAKSLKVGNKLVSADGAPDPIVSIEVSQVYGKVYNVGPVSIDYTSNIVVAGGYLNGSVRYQNEFLNTINSIILRRSLAEYMD